MSEEREVIEIEYCDKCEKVMGFPAKRKDDSEYEWGCVGLITEPQDPTDIHDCLNKIRFCIEGKTYEEIDSHEWTAWEAQMVLMGLSFAVARHLEDFQPTQEQIDILLKNGITDHKLNVT